MKNIIKYLDDERFINWVFQPDVEYGRFWENYKSDHPSEVENINVAKRILNNLKTKDKDFTADEKILFFATILKRLEVNEKKKERNLFIKNLLKYAAVAILFFAFGSILFYRQNDLKPEYYLQAASGSVHSDEARLIRPDGLNIPLAEKRSVIEHMQNGSVMVNNDLINSADIAKNGTPDLNRLVIPYGKTSKLILPDGSTVFLNAGSQLVYPDFFKDKFREVFLVGEAFFNVFENKRQPFVVQTTDVRIKVLGTKFNVSAYPSDKIIETVLTEGQIKLEPNNAGLFDPGTELVPGQLASYDKTSKKTKLEFVDIRSYTMWKDGMLSFESTDLSRVIKQLERYYNIRFVYEDPLLGSIRISGKLELSENRQDIIGNLAKAADISIIMMDESYYEIKK
jgi:hypothetical protein